MGSFQNLLEFEQVLQLLLYFDLVFKIDAEPSKFFIPQYLPERSDVKITTAAYFNSFPSVTIESDSYLMNLVMLKVFSRFGNFVSKSGENYQFWKDGLVIGEHGKYELKIVFHREKQQVEIFENKDATTIDFLKVVVGYILSLTARFDFDIQITNASDREEQATKTIIEESKPMLLFSWESDYFQTYLSIEADRKVAYRSLKEARELKNRYCKCIEGNSVDIIPFEKFFKVTNTMSSKAYNQGVNYNQLLQKFKNQSVVVFIGSGVSAYTTKGAKLATWRGLLEDGINHCIEVANCNQKWKELRMKQLNTNDLDEWLSVAEIISSKLKKYNHFKTWLRNSVGQLPNDQPELIQKIGELNTQIYTTNYDNLLSKNLSRGVISNQNVEKIQGVLSGNRNEIVHLHGFFDDSETVILGNVSYSDLSHNEFFQAIQQSVFNSKHILFVGFGSGLEDPNFGSLLEWTKNFTSSEHHHYRLVLENEKEKLSVDSKIQNLVYGENYDDLLPFFENLVKDVQSP